MQEKKTANFWIQFLDKKFSHNPDSLVFQNYERMCLMNGVKFPTKREKTLKYAL